MRTGHRSIHAQENVPYSPYFFIAKGHEKTHMAYRKKYKALVLKQVPCILKYMPYIFRLSEWLKNNNLQKWIFYPFLSRFSAAQERLSGLPKQTFGI